MVASREAIKEMRQRARKTNQKRGECVLELVVACATSIVASSTLGEGARD